MTEAFYVCLNRVQYKLSNCSTLMSLQIDFYLIDYAFKTLEYNSSGRQKYLYGSHPQSYWLDEEANQYGIKFVHRNMKHNNMRVKKGDTLLYIPFPKLGLKKMKFINFLCMILV